MDRKQYWELFLDVCWGRNVTASLCNMKDRDAGGHRLAQRHLFVLAASTHHVYQAAVLWSVPLSDSLPRSPQQHSEKCKEEKSHFQHMQESGMPHLGMHVAACVVAGAPDTSHTSYQSSHRGRYLVCSSTSPHSVQLQNQHMTRSAIMGHVLVPMRMCHSLTARLHRPALLQPLPLPLQLRQQVAGLTGRSR